MTTWRPWSAAAVLLVLVSLLPGTRAAFTGHSSLQAAVSSDGLLDRLVVERPDPATAQPAAAAPVRHVEQLRPLGGGLVADVAAARSAADDGASATVAETGSDRLRVPVNGGFDADTEGWTGSATGSLAAGSAGRSATAGDPGGALTFSVAGSGAAPVDPGVTWSTTFAHTGGARAVSLRHDVRLVSSTGLTSTNRLTAELVAPGGAVTVLSRSPLAAGPVGTGASPWRTATGSAPGTVMSQAGSYTLRLRAELHLRQGTDASAVAVVDDVALDVTGTALGPVPANGTFLTGTEGWTATTTASAGVTSLPAWSPSDGEPPGSMRASVTSANTLLAATGTVNWSTTFEHVGGSAGRATFDFSHRILLGNEVTDETGYTVSLRKPGGQVVPLLPKTRLVPVAFPGLDPGPTRRSVPVPAEELDETGTYHLDVLTEVYTNAVSGGSTNAVGLSIGYDNIRLDRVATGRHLDVEAVVPVAYRSAARLEWRAATTGDPVAVTVWRDGAWRDVGAVTATGLTETAVALTHRADAAEAEVRVRFTSQKDASSDDVLRLDWLRVVPDDPPLHAGDTSLTLPAVATGATASRLSGVLRLRNRGAVPLELSLDADAPVLAWAGFAVASAAGGVTCTAGWTDGVALSTRCLLPPGGSVGVDVRVVGGRPPGSWTAALVLSDVARPGYFRAVLPALVSVTA